MLSQYVYLPKIGVLWRTNLLFEISISQNLKISLPIFMYENKFLMLYNVPYFQSN